MTVAIVTGASSGMGREFVLQLGRYVQVDEIWVIARREDKLKELQNEVKVPLHILPLDLLQAESYNKLKAELEKEQPRVTLLVNASGFGRFGAFEDIPLELQLEMIDLNSKALVAMTYRTLPYMQSGAEIFEVGSLSAFQPVPYIGVYGASKSFVLSFSRAIGVELKKKGIRVMAICPGWVKTSFFDRAVTDDTITYYNRFYTAEQVVTRALRDMKKGKDVSVCGKQIRAQVLLTKLLPHRLVMKIWCKQQKK